ncbi:cation:proton antiporter [Nonomuraea ferruginea]|uniref:Cation:proton antiporter n=1 Tax=Nonomuraea ferruginea TaxID=46174 RepID=A0ABT4SY37_9ACTN|nr:cation:proton antiporter [Nonomuraea ferruginea]MDA0642171.1 cation:proton antiporter [Nonomuraea ferruginea]
MLTGVPLFLLQLVVILASAVLLGRLASRLGQPAIVGELAAGVLLGPAVLGQLAPGWAQWLPRPGSGALIDAVAQLGLLLLVGLTAAELDLGRLREQAGTLARVSAWALLLPLVLGAAAGFVVPAALLGPAADRVTFAAYLGVALSVTAIPVISRTLSDLRLLGHRVGQITLASGACQDSVAWILLAVVGAMATSGAGPETIGMPLLWLAVMLLAALVLRPLARRVLSVADPAPAMTMSAVVIITGALAAHLAGLEPVVGAFVAGLVAGAAKGAGARHLAGLRTAVIAVLAPVFLAFAGLHLDLAALAEPVVALTAAGLLALAVAGKLAGGYIGARTSGMPPWESFAIGAGLNSRGLIEIIVATVGLRLGILTPAAYSIVVLIAVATSLLAPPLLRAAFKRAPEQNGERHGRGASERDHPDLHRPGHR